MKEFDWITHVIDLGFPIAGACIAGFFIFLVFKFILAGVTGSVQSMKNMIGRLDSRVDVMNNQLAQIDAKISQALGIDLDYTRLSRAEKKDLRKD
jgi:hypothetical protein